MQTTNRHRTRSTSQVDLRAVGLSLLGLLLAAGCGPKETTTPPSNNQQQASYPTEKEEAARASNNGKADWSVDVCQRNGWYGDKACDWFCPDDDPDCNLEPLGPEPSGEATSYPLVLHHGFMGADSGLWSYHDVPEALEADGHDVYESEVPPFHSVEVRAESLAEDVDWALAESGADKVNIVAHSMGGLDTRYLVSQLGYDDRVASVTTIASPHGGTAIADAYLNLMPEFTDKAFNAVAELTGRSFNDEGNEADVRAAMEDLAESNIEQFNRQNPDAEGVYYQSWTGISSVAGVRVDGLAEACDDKLLMHEGTMDHMDKLLWSSAAVVAGGTDLQLNDGMVRVPNAKWGNFRGCIPADHLDQVGQIADEGPDEDTGFDHLRFYRNLAFDLAERGF